MALKIPFSKKKEEVKAWEKACQVFFHFFLPKISKYWLALTGN